MQDLRAEGNVVSEEDNAALDALNDVYRKLFDHRDSDGPFDTLGEFRRNGWDVVRTKPLHAVKDAPYEYKTAQVVITRGITSDGADVTNVDTTPDDIGLVEVLGLLRLAEDTMLTCPPAGDVE